MVELTEAARTQLDAYFADKDKSPIRVYLTSGGCSGPKLALALDTPKDSDDVITAGGHDFVIDKDLYAQAAPLTIDMGYMGFSVASSLQLGGGGCGSSCSSGSCGC